MAVENDQKFVEYIVKEIVSDSDKVSIKRTVDEMGVLLELTVAKEDMGVVVGKEGKTVNSIRTLLRVLGAKTDSRLNLKIVEPEGGERPAPKKDKNEEPVAEEETEAKKEDSEEASEETDEEPMADLDLDE